MTSLVIIILLLADLGQVGSDLYLSSLPAISHSLSTHVNSVQLSVSLYMYGLACSQLIYGPVSDALGRKKPLTVGLSIMLIGSIICVYSITITGLIIGRFLQGVGAGSGITLSRAILRDLYRGVELAKFASYLSIAGIAIMASAPLLGSYILYYFGWRANFVFLTLFSLALLITVVSYLPETNKHLHADHLKIKVLIQNSKTLLTDPKFIAFSIIIFMAYGGILAWLTVAPVLLQNKVGLTPVDFGWNALLIGCAYAIGAFLNTRLVVRIGMITSHIIGSAFMFLGGASMLILGLLHFLNSFVIVIPIIIFVFGSSMVFSNAFASALTPYPKIAGFAGSLFGFMQILGGAITSTVLSFLHEDNQLPLAIMLTTTSIIAMLTLLWVKTYDTEY